MGSRPRLHGGGGRRKGGFPLSSSRGVGSRWEQRRRGGGWVPASARTREGWVPALVFTGGRLFAGTTDAGEGWGSPHPRGHGRGVGSRTRLPAGRFSVGTTEPGGHWDGSPHPRGHGRGMGSRPRLHGGRLCAGTTEAGGIGMGPRIREDTGGCTPIPRLHEGRL